jgi:hypothetical protein
LQGVEAVNMIRKGRVRWVARHDAVAAADFINELFSIAAYIARVTLSFLFIRYLSVHFNKLRIEAFSAGAGAFGAELRGVAREVTAGVVAGDYHGIEGESVSAGKVYSRVQCQVHNAGRGGRGHRFGKKDNTMAIGNRHWQIDRTRFRHMRAGSTVHEHLRYGPHVVGQFSGEGHALVEWGPQQRRGKDGGVGAAEKKQVFPVSPLP